MPHVIPGQLVAMFSEFFARCTILFTKLTYSSCIPLYTKGLEGVSVTRRHHSIPSKRFCLYCLYLNDYWGYRQRIQYIPINMHTVFALLCFVVVIHWLIFPYPPGLLHWHCGNLTIAPVPAKQSWWIWINTSCEFIMNDCITTTKQSTIKPCAFFLGYTV